MRKLLGVVLVISFSITVLCSGCAVLPNYNKEVNGSADKIKPQLFKYGKYCGKKHPNFKSIPGTIDRTKDLLGHWPPVDDIDLMCYAHDMCFQETTQSNLICDQALSSILTYRNLFTQETGCRNLLVLISSVILGKPQGTEENKKAARWVSIANSVIAIPAGAAQFAMTYPSMQKYGLPKGQGDCHMNSIDRLHSLRVISDFEQSYRHFAKSFKKYGRGTPGKYEIKIEMPIGGWAKKLEIFDMQKYLNYFGFNVGTADGLKGVKTINGINMFNMISPIDKPVSAEIFHRTLDDLYAKYDKRSFLTKTKEHGYTTSESKRVYGFMD